MTYDGFYAGWEDRSLGLESRRLAELTGEVGREIDRRKRAAVVTVSMPRDELVRVRDAVAEKLNHGARSPYGTMGSILTALNEALDGG